LTCSSSRGWFGFVATAERLEEAWRLETKVLALTIGEREDLLRSLKHARDGPAELRRVLAREREWRVQQGLV
jgi:hypothetical protein